MKKVYASAAGAHLDSSVYTGGGTDDTELLQKILDSAPECGGIHLVLDGAALISRTLRVRSDTVIECPGKNCGAFLAPGSDCCMLANAHSDMKQLRDRNIRLIGGTWNQNSRSQAHHKEAAAQDEPWGNWIYILCFCGIKDLEISGVTLLNQRTFAGLFAAWKNVRIENVSIERDFRDPYQNQDGLHFWGPGRFLELRNICGNTGDDFIALAPDEFDEESSIEDVTVDGVMLDDADQGIRLLSRGTGRLDRVFIRNVCGTMANYGFYINPWFEGRGGNFGHIEIENVDIRPIAPVYDYRTPILFDIAGNVENLVIRNVNWYSSCWGNRFADLGGHYITDGDAGETEPSGISSVRFENVTVNELPGAKHEGALINVRCPVRILEIRDVYPGLELEKLVWCSENGSADDLRIR